ncbi:Hypothetical protein A7982_01704 [Minicystis rosea]|nr:Hypothetical protein A7982_01704 [Minicystis rosea]
MTALHPTGAPPADDLVDELRPPEPIHLRAVAWIEASRTIPWTQPHRGARRAMGRSEPSTPRALRDLAPRAGSVTNQK